MPQRKFPVVDEEKDLVHKLDSARRWVNKAERAVSTARDAKAAARGVLDRAEEEERKAEAELAKAQAERDSLSLQSAEAVKKRGGGGAAAQTALAQEPSATPFAAVLESKLAHVKTLATNLESEATLATKELATAEASLKDLYAKRKSTPTPPVDDSDSDKEGAEGKRERSPRGSKPEKPYAAILRRVKLQEEKKAKLEAIIEDRKTKHTATTARIAHLQTLIGDANATVAGLEAELSIEAVIPGGDESDADLED